MLLLFLFNYLENQLGNKYLHSLTRSASALSLSLKPLPVQLYLLKRMKQLTNPKFLVFYWRFHEEVIILMMKCEIHNLDQLSLS